jgi:hypothetical protein
MLDHDNISLTIPKIDDKIINIYINMCYGQNTY